MNAPQEVAAPLTRMYHPFMVTLGDIEKARSRIGDSVFLSPCAKSEILSGLTGCEVYLKLENLQMTGSYEERGSLNKILQLNDPQKAAGVITASAGNHAQGVAHAAQLSGIAATIVMPETTPLSKVRGTQEFGAHSKILERGLESDGRLTRLKIVVPDKPGSIAELATLVARHRANILQISQNRSMSEVKLEETEVELTLETRGLDHTRLITNSINDHGFRVK